MESARDRKATPTERRLAKILDRRHFMATMTGAGIAGLEPIQVTVAKVDPDAKSAFEAAKQIMWASALGASRDTEEKAYSFTSDAFAIAARPPHDRPYEKIYDQFISNFRGNGRMGGPWTPAVADYVLAYSKVIGILARRIAEKDPDNMKYEITAAHLDAAILAVVTMAKSAKVGGLASRPQGPDSGAVAKGMDVWCF